ncbi:MAG: glycosyltransferase [Anaerolineaceae bacterium]|nr:glycosyltransferase [Anaerolineaceae bacterium]
MSTNNSRVKKERIHVLEVLGNAIVGGMENYVRSLIGALPANEFKISCLCPYESPITADLRRMGHDVFITPIDPDPTWQSVQTTVGVIRSQNVQLLHAHLPPAHILAGLAGALTQKPVVATVHGMAGLESVGIQQINNSHLIVICQAAYMQVLAYGVPRTKVSLIRNGVDLTRFTPRSDCTELRTAFRQAVGIPGDAPLIGLVGRLSWEKGPDQFIRAARVVNKRCSEAHFVLVGEGPFSGELEELVAELKLEDRVHFAGLWPDTAVVYPALDILAQTSRTEGMPLALLEGMACGRPFAGMGVGGVLEIVEARSTGLLSAPGDWDGLAHALLMLLANPEMATKMGQAARQHVENEFSLKNTAVQTGALFNRLVQSQNPARRVQPSLPNHKKLLNLNPRMENKS